MYSCKYQRIRPYFCQFRSFTDQANDDSIIQRRPLARCLDAKEFELDDKTLLRAEIEKHYGQEVQKLCWTSRFRVVCNNLEDIDLELLEIIIANAKETSPLLTSLVLSVGPMSKTAIVLYYASMKLIAILVILCISAHQNNSNYFPLLFAIYLHSAGAKVDAITLLNHLGLFLSYNVVLKTPRNINSFSESSSKSKNSTPSS